MFQSYLLVILRYSFYMMCNLPQASKIIRDSFWSEEVGNHNSSDHLF